MARAVEFNPRNGHVIRFTNEKVIHVHLRVPGVLATVCILLVNEDIAKPNLRETANFPKGRDSGDESAKGNPPGVSPAGSVQRGVVWVMRLSCHGQAVTHVGAIAPLP